MILENPHQVYAYYDPRKNNQTFYIGETGTDDRWLYHLEEAKRIIKQKKSQKWVQNNCDNPHKTRTIMKILEAGFEPIIEKLMENVSEQQAKAEEIRLIALHGRADLGLGPLTNMTDGGEGQSGRIWTEESRQKLIDNHGSKNKKMYNNGIEGKYFAENEQPDGWIKGRLEEYIRTGEQHPNYGKINPTKVGGLKWYNNEKEMFRFVEGEQPEGWVKGTLHKGENNPNYGRIVTEEQKRSQSEKMSGENHPFYGKPCSEERRRNISKANKGRKLTEEQRNNISDRMIGKGIGKDNPNYKNRGENSPLYGKKWYNNGTEQAMFNEATQPVGWVAGMVKK